MSSEILYRYSILDACYSCDNRNNSQWQEPPTSDLNHEGAKGHEENQRLSFDFAQDKHTKYQIPNTIYYLSLP